MAKRIVLASQKGGVGKTTVALNLAVALAEKGHRTLLVDLDPQGAIGHSLAVEDSEWPGLAERLMDEIPIEEAIVDTKLANLSILPRGRLDPLDTSEYETVMNIPGALEKVLDEADPEYQYTIIDTVSGLGMITRAALALSQFTLVPLQAESLSLRSAGQVLRVIDHVAQEEGSDLQLLGLLLTMVDFSKEPGMRELGRHWFGYWTVLETVIPRSEVFNNASISGLPVGFLPGPTSLAARRFEGLVDELESRMEKLSERTGQEREHAQRELL